LAQTIYILGDYAIICPTVPTPDSFEIMTSAIHTVNITFIFLLHSLKLLHRDYLKTKEVNDDCKINLILILKFRNDLPPHAVERFVELMLGKVVLQSEDARLLQADGHSRPVLGTLTACQSDTFKKKNIVLITTL
jgi:hypothetical protein